MIHELWWPSWPSFYTVDAFSSFHLLRSQRGNGNHVINGIPHGLILIYIYRNQNNKVAPIDGDDGVSIHANGTHRTTQANAFRLRLQQLNVHVHLPVTSVSIEKPCARLEQPFRCKQSAYIFKSTCKAICKRCLCPCPCAGNMVGQCVNINNKNLLAVSIVCECIRSFVYITQFTHHMHRRLSRLPNCLVDIT